MGQDGFMRTVKQSMDTANRLKAGISSIDGLKMLGRCVKSTNICPHFFSSPDMSVLAFTSTDPAVNVFVVADIVQDEFKFSLERQQLPPSLHTTIMPRHAYIVDDLIEAIKKGVETARKNPSLVKKGLLWLHQGFRMNFC